MLLCKDDECAVHARERGTLRLVKGVAKAKGSAGRKETRQKVEEERTYVRERCSNGMERGRKRGRGRERESVMTYHDRQHGVDFPNVILALVEDVDRDARMLAAEAAHAARLEGLHARRKPLSPRTRLSSSAPSRTRARLSSLGALGFIRGRDRLALSALRCPCHPSSYALRFALACVRRRPRPTRGNPEKPTKGTKSEAKSEREKRFLMVGVVVAREGGR